MQASLRILGCCITLFFVYNPTLVVSQGKVGVVGGLWCQAVVEVLSTPRFIWIHGCHGLDQLGEGGKLG